MSNWNDREDRLERHPIVYSTGWAIGLVLAVLATLALIGVLSTGSVFFTSAASNVTLKPRVNVQRNSTQNAVASITFFHTTCQTANAQLRIVENNEQRLKSDQSLLGSTDTIKAQQAQADVSGAQDDVTGAENVLDTTVANYNAQAANSLNAKFRESGLPERINLPDPVPAGYSINCG